MKNLIPDDVDQERRSDKFFEDNRIRLKYKDDFLATIARLEKLQQDIERLYALVYGEEALSELRNSGQKNLNHPVAGTIRQKALEQTNLEKKSP